MSAQTYQQQYRTNGYRQRQYQQGSPKPSQEEKPTPPERSFDEVAQFCQELGLDAEVVGKWIWVDFVRKPDRELIQQLKNFGFRWSPRWQKWAHNCGHHCQPGQGDPRDKYPHHPLDLNDADRQQNSSRNSYSKRRYA